MRLAFAAPCLFALLALAACSASPAHLPAPRAAEGRAIAMEAKGQALPADHPALGAGDPSASSDRVGRAPRRLTVDQLRASLLVATGFTWVASRRVSDPEAPSGVTNLPDADMLEALASTLGRADYATTTSESLDPAVTFAKLAGDAARSACRASVKADLAIAQAPRREEERRILRFVGPAETSATSAASVRKNLAYLALRFWGRRIEPNDAQLGALQTLFDRASSAAGPPDGWRAVCIAMATDPQFLTY